MKSIEEIKREYLKEKGWLHADFNEFVRESLFEPSYHLDEVAKRYAQQFQDESETYRKSFEALQEAVLKSAERNKELVEMLEDIRNRMEVGAIGYEIVELEIASLITKHKQS